MIVSWEYHVERVYESSDNNGEYALKRLGSEGWELVFILHEPYLLLYLKRPIEKK